MGKYLPSILLLSVLILIAGISTAGAEKSEPQEETWNRMALSVGGYMNAVDSQVTFGLKGFDTNINVEEAFGLDVSTTVFRVDSFVRFTPNRRHRFDVGWYSVRRDGGKQIGKDITIGDTTFSAGTTVNTFFNLDIYRGTYTYSFFQDDRMDLALGVGAYLAPTKFEIRSEGADGTLETEGESFAVPLPVFCLRGDFAVTPKIFIRNKIDLFYLEVGDFKGAISNVNIGLEWKIIRNLSVGLSFDSFHYKVRSENSSYPYSDFLGEFSYRNVGVMAFVKTQVF
jgi:hypothetical protein